MNVQEQIKYYQHNPPSNISEFNIQSVTLDGVLYDGHGFSGMYPDDLMAKLDIVFRIECKCGGQNHCLIAECIEGEVYFHDGIIGADRFYLKCVSCGKQTLLFDPFLHGYNAEIFALEELEEDGETEIINVGASDIGEYKCQDCETQNFEIFTRFEYSGDGFEIDFKSDKPQAFYSWFTVVAKCSECSLLNKPIEYECA